METTNQVIAGVFQNHQFEFEARQQWEHRIRSLESLVDEAVAYTSDQAMALHQKINMVVNLEGQLATMHTKATGEVARFGQEMFEEGQAIFR